MDKSEIQKQAQEILDKFAKALSKVKTSKEDFYVDRDNFEREEKESEKCDFKLALLENAPKKDNDFIIAEKGGWK